jgi:hypothetical protein
LPGIAFAASAFFVLQNSTDARIIRPVWKKFDSSKPGFYQRKIPGGYSIFEMIVTKRVVKWCKVHEAGWFDDFGEFLFSGP